MKTKTATGAPGFRYAPPEEVVARLDARGVFDLERGTPVEPATVPEWVIATVVERMRVGGAPCYALRFQLDGRPCMAVVDELAIEGTA